MGAQSAVTVRGNSGNGPNTLAIIFWGILIIGFLFFLALSATGRAGEEKSYGELAQQAAEDLQIAENAAADALDEGDAEKAEEELEQAWALVVTYGQAKNLAAGEGADLSDLNNSVQILKNLLESDRQRLQKLSPEMAEQLDRFLKKLLPGE